MAKYFILKAIYLFIILQRISLIYKTKYMTAKCLLTRRLLYIFTVLYAWLYVISTLIVTFSQMQVKMQSVLTIHIHIYIYTCY